MMTFLPKWRSLYCSVTLALFVGSVSLHAETRDHEYSVGGYIGQFYDSNPIKFLGGLGTTFENHYIGALTISKTLWQSETYPLAVEIEGDAAYQFGEFELGEFGIVPVIRWRGFPWNHYLPTTFRFGPIGLSWTTSVSPFEKTNKGGSQWLNFLIVDVGVSLLGHENNEVFLRLHHRCSMFESMNDYDTNGEDFLAIGFRHYF